MKAAGQVLRQYFPRIADNAGTVLRDQPAIIGAVGLVTLSFALLLVLHDNKGAPFLMLSGVLLLTLLMKGFRRLVAKTKQHKQLWKLQCVVLNLLMIVLFAGMYALDPAMVDGDDPILTSYADAFYFAATVQFTIGFGDKSPASAGSKLVAVTQYIMSFYLNVLGIVEPLLLGIKSDLSDDTMAIAAQELSDVVPSMMQSPWSLSPAQPLPPPSGAGSSPAVATPTTPATPAAAVHAPSPTAVPSPRSGLST